MFVKHQFFIIIAIIIFVFPTSYIFSCAIHSFSQVAGLELCSFQVNDIFMGFLGTSMSADHDTGLSEALFCRMLSCTKA